MDRASSESGIQFSALPAITGGEMISFHKDARITDLVLDSRKTASSDGRLFFAIRGERHDGHDYVRNLYAQGVRYFIVERVLPDWRELSDASFLQVTNAVTALQRIAAFHRSRFSLPVIGITGSNGKTIIKEWLFQLLSRTESVVKNPGSYNSQIGVPLSVWRIDSRHSLGIFEAGVSKAGEMQNLQAIIQPSIGIFTNIGPAHSEGFRDVSEKMREKLDLFRDVKVLICCRDHQLLYETIRQSGLPVLSWGFSEGSDIKISKSSTEYAFALADKVVTFEIPFKDSASVENCLHCITVMLYLNHDPVQIQNGIRMLRSIPMRLELKEGINQCQVIDDTYNNDLSGIEISLQFLSHQRQKGKKSLILSDVLESGMEGQALALKISALVKKYQVNRFIAIGPLLSRHRQVFDRDASFFESTDDFINRFDFSSFRDEVILVKGARVFGFERITRALQRKIHGTVMEIDLGALIHNFNYIKSRLRKSTKVMVMVKAFAYGSGSIEVASLLQYHQADYLGVAYADEGVELRKHNITLPLMVMNPAEESFDLLLQHDLEPEVYSFAVLESLIKFLNGRNCRVHVKLDTGMHRLGFEPGQVNALKDVLVQNKNLTVASIFSHLAGADEANHDEFSEDQANAFREAADFLSLHLGYKPLYHLLNSPGILRLPQHQFDMVRLGIGLYGVDPTDKGDAPLRPVATLKTIISQIKHIRAGETIGYGRKGVAAADMKIATIAIGYADGYSRAFSRGVGKVLLHGKLAPVVGNVCMDMTMIDVTGISADAGDEVIIFGRDLPIQQISGWIGTIPYEVLTSTSERVKRIFTAESL